MVAPVIGAAAISAGANLLGGYLDREAREDSNKANAAQAAQNRADQFHFAENSIKMRVDDANRSGVHPIYALGSPGMSFSPVSVGNVPETGMGTALGNMGQDISRSVAAYRPPGEKVAAVQTAQQTASNALDLDTKKLNNEILRVKLAGMTQPGTPPGVTFDVPENPKIEQNPKLMAGGRRVDTNPNTSPQKAFEDRYGDDGWPSWVSQTVIADQDLQHNFGSPATWPGKMAQWAAQAFWQDLQNEKRNVQRFIKDGSSVVPRRDRPRGYY